MIQFSLPLVLGAVLRFLAVGVVTRVLLTLGFSTVAYYGIGELMAEAENYVFSYMGQSGSEIVSLLAMARVDDAVRVMFSALSAVLAIKGVMTGGAYLVGRWAAKPDA